MPSFDNEHIHVTEDGSLLADWPDHLKVTGYDVTRMNDPRAFRAWAEAWIGNLLWLELRRPEGDGKWQVLYSNGEPVLDTKAATRTFSWLVEEIDAPLTPPPEWSTDYTRAQPTLLEQHAEVAPTDEDEADVEATLAAFRANLPHFGDE